MKLEKIFYLLFLIVAVLAGNASAQTPGATQYPTALDGGTSFPALADNKATALTIALNSSATTITVASTTGFPSSGIVWIGGEQIAYTGTTATTFTGCTRGFGGTQAVPHPVNSTARFMLSNSHVSGPRGAVLAIEAKLGVGASDAAGATTGHCLVKQADGRTAWASCGGGAAALDDLSDVSLSAPALGKYLRHNGTLWVDGVIQASDLPIGIDAAKVADGSVSNAEFQYLDGTTSGIQSQLNGKAAASHTHAQADVTNLVTDLAAKQASDSDLTAIAVLAPTNDDVLQRKAGAWTNRTPAQLKTDLALVKGDVGLGNVTNDAQLKVASNLSDLNSASSARTNLGLGTSSSVQFGALGIGTAPAAGVAVDALSNFNGDLMLRFKNQSAGTSANAQVQLLNDLSDIWEFGLYSSGNTGYGAVAARDGFMYSTTNMVFMSDGPTGLIKFATGGNAETARLDAAGKFSAVSLSLGGGVTWSKGSGAPAGACTTGSLYSRTDGGTGSTLYVCESSAWVAK